MIYTEADFERAKVLVDHTVACFCNECRAPRVAQLIADVREEERARCLKHLATVYDNAPEAPDWVGPSLDRLEKMIESGEP